MSMNINYSRRGVLSLLAAGTGAFAAPCKDAKGKFTKCPPAKAKVTRCRLNGKFAACSAKGAKPM